MKLQDLLNQAEKLNWTCKEYEDYVSFTKYSPEGQEHFHEVELTLNEKGEIDFHSFVEELENQSECFDVERNAMLWVDDDGHGKNGAPYHYKDLLNDMKWCKKESVKLSKKLNQYVIKHINK